jgi:hypothetical protein
LVLLYTLNFDVAVTAVITDHDEIILSVVARRLPSLNVNAGEVNVALLAVKTAVNLSSSQILLEGDSLVIISALNNCCSSAE